MKGNSWSEMRDQIREVKAKLSNLNVGSHSEQPDSSKVPMVNSDGHDHDDRYPLDNGWLKVKIE
jgi:hypothetical protein